MVGSTNFAIRKTCPCGNERQPPPSPSKCLEWQSSVTREEISIELNAEIMSCNSNSKSGIKLITAKAFQTVNENVNVVELYILTSVARIG